MLLLLFEIGGGRYAFDIKQVIEIVPLVKFKKIPATPDYVAGLMNYRGTGTPVIDLNQLVDAVSFEDVLSTRIIIVNYAVGGKGNRPLALIANNVTETASVQMTKPPPAGVIMDKSIYEGEIVPDTNNIVQWFDLKKILSDKDITMLFEADA